MILTQANECKIKFESDDESQIRLILDISLVSELSKAELEIEAEKLLVICVSNLAKKLFIK